MAAGADEPGGGGEQPAGISDNVIVGFRRGCITSRVGIGTRLARGSDEDEHSFRRSSRLRLWLGYMPALAKRDYSDSQIRGRRQAVGEVLLAVAVHSALRLEVDGRENIPARGAALLVSNHVSHVDPLVLWAIGFQLGRRIRVLAVQEAFEKPLVGSVVRKLGWIPLKPEHGAEALDRIRVALQKGDLVLIYPEGTIPAVGQIVPARPGAAFAALQSSVAVIPVATIGLDKNAQARRQVWRLWRRSRVIVRIGAPILPDALSAVAQDAGYQAASEALLATVRSLLAAGPVGRAPGPYQR